MHGTGRPPYPHLAHARRRRTWTLLPSWCIQPGLFSGVRLVSYRKTMVGGFPPLATFSIPPFPGILRIAHPPTMPSQTTLSGIGIQRTTLQPMALQRTGF